MEMSSLWYYLTVRSVIWGVLAGIFRASGCAGSSYSPTKNIYILLGREPTQGVHVLLLQYQQKLIGRLVLTASLGYSMIREKVLHESCKKMGTRSMLLRNR